MGGGRKGDATKKKRNATKTKRKKAHLLGSLEGELSSDGDGDEVLCEGKRGKRARSAAANEKRTGEKREKGTRKRTL